MNPSPSNPFDRDARALVIGAGPAGAAAACVLARAIGEGNSFHVERSAWPRPKACGCCLGPAGVNMLGALGLAVDARLGGEPLHEIDFLCTNARARVRHEGGMAIARDRLDSALVDHAVASGATFVPETSARVLRREGDRWMVRLTTRGHEPVERAFSLVIVADGIGGTSLDDIQGLDGTADMKPRIARNAWMGVSTVIDPDAAGFQDMPEPGLVRMHVGHGGYVGLVRVSGGRVAVGAALDPETSRACGGPSILIAMIMESCGQGPLALPPAQDAGSRLLGTGLLTRRRDRIALPGLMVIGDAAGYVEPFTGEGMTWAIASGVRAAEVGARALESNALEELAASWNREQRRLVRRRQRTCAVVRWMVHRPALVARTLDLMDRFAIVSRVGEATARATGAGYRTPTLANAAARGTTGGVL